MTRSSTGTTMNTATPQAALHTLRTFTTATLKQSPQPVPISSPTPTPSTPNGSYVGSPSHGSCPQPKGSTSRQGQADRRHTIPKTRGALARAPEACLHRVADATTAGAVAPQPIFARRSWTKCCLPVPRSGRQPDPFIVCSQSPISSTNSSVRSPPTEIESRSSGSFSSLRGSRWE